MRSQNYSTAGTQEIYDKAADCLLRHLQFSDYGRKCQVSILLSVLLFAAARKASIDCACQRLARAPCAQTIFNALHAWLGDHAELERRANLALSHKLPAGVRRKRQKIAIDLTCIPYHGEPEASVNELRHGAPKGGTTHFHTYATAYVVRRGARFTLAMTYVWKNDSLPEVLRRLIQRVRKIGVKIDFLLLDREFYGLEVVRFLQRARCPFLMPVVRRGRKPKVLEKAKGAWRFWSWKRSVWTTHTLRNKNQTVVVDIAVAIDHYAGRFGKQGLRHLVYACWGLPHRAPHWIRNTYRERFGIESSYRQMNEARIRTCTRSVQLRLLFCLIALVLRNLWVWFHHVHYAIARGPYLQLRLNLLRLSTLLLQLEYHAEAHLGRASPM